MSGGVIPSAAWLQPSWLQTPAIACALLDEGHGALSKAESGPMTLRSGWLEEEEEAAELWALVPGPSACPGHS